MNERRSEFERVKQRVRGEKKVEKKIYIYIYIYIKRFSISLCTVLLLELHYLSMLKILSFRTFDVRGFLVFGVLNVKNLAMMSTLCQIYAFYRKCDVLTFKRNLFYFSFF